MISVKTNDIEHKEEFRISLKYYILICWEWFLPALKRLLLAKYLFGAFSTCGLPLRVLVRLLIPSLCLGEEGRDCFPSIPLSPTSVLSDLALMLSNVSLRPYSLGNPVQYSRCVHWVERMLCSSHQKNNVTSPTRNCRPGFKIRGCLDWQQMCL